MVKYVHTRLYFRNCYIKLSFFNNLFYSVKSIEVVYNLGVNYSG